MSRQNNSSGVELFQKTPVIIPKKRSSSLDMHLNIPLLGRGFKSSNSKPGCGISALNYLDQIEIPNGFLKSTSYEVIHQKTVDTE
jgi:hypothetical protein